MDDDSDYDDDWWGSEPPSEDINSLVRNMLTCSPGRYIFGEFIDPEALLEVS